MTIDIGAAVRSADSSRPLDMHRLSVLRRLRQSLVAYYQALLEDRSELLRVAALVALLDLRAVSSHQAQVVVDHCHHGAVKRRAFPFFVSVFAYDFAEKVSVTPSEDVDDLLSRRMRAELALDYGEMANLDLELYMAHGAPEYLADAAGNAEREGGWRASVPLFVTAVLARPMDQGGSFQLLSALRMANQPDMVRDVCEEFEASQIYRSEASVFRAALLIDDGDNRGALKLLERIPPNAPNPILNAFNLQLRGEAFNSLGAFSDSNNAYKRMNSGDRATNVDPKAFFRSMERRNAFKFSEHQQDARAKNVLFMVGFPRSGTTLLENALGVHPKLETFEETVALSRMAQWFERFAPPSQEINDELAEQGRDKYFDELNRREQKSAATIKVDKMPISSAYAGFLHAIMPDARYIFSIRHPRDVILSCFRQIFVHNPAMENFRTIADACVLYDATMTNWFSVHTLDDPTVCYVRYEELVNEFRPTLERVLGFIGVGWDDAVLNFVEAADKRFAKTPSYQKVRSGLSIGVQSSRENYKFLFETKETAVLKKWVKHFGYED